MLDSKGRKVLGVVMSIGKSGVIMSALIAGSDGRPELGESMLEDGTVVNPDGSVVGHVDDLVREFAATENGDDVVSGHCDAKYLN